MILGHNKHFPVGLWYRCIEIDGKLEGSISLFFLLAVLRQSRGDFPVISFGFSMLTSLWSLQLNPEFLRQRLWIYL